MFRVAVLSFALSAVFAAPSFAAENTGAYINLGVTQLSSDLDLTDLDISGATVDLGDQSVDITMLTGRVGYRLNNFLALEGELGFGLGEENLDQLVPVNIDGTIVDVDTNIDLSINNYYVGFARAILPVSDEFEVFVRAGYGQAKAEADVTASVGGFSASGSASDKESGVAYGLGAQYNFTAKDGIRLDYTRLEDSDILGIAYSRRF